MKRGLDSSDSALVDAANSSYPDMGVSEMNPFTIEAGVGRGETIDGIDCPVETDDGGPKNDTRVSDDIDCRGSGVRLM